MAYYLIRFIETCLSPPGLMIMLMLAGLLLHRRRPRLGRQLLSAGLGLLILFSLPISSQFMFWILEDTPHLSSDALGQSGAGAIVILGGGRYTGPEYGEETISTATLTRLRYGARLHHLTGLPILLSGGSPRGESVSEAELMATTLRESFGIEAKWLDKKSRNTWENAQFSRDILKNTAISRIFLVTHANHMPRSVAVFEKAGLAPIPAPLDYRGAGKLSLLSFLPSAHGLSNAKIAFHELLGRIWYALRYQ